MKLATRFSLITTGIVIILSFLLESISLTVFNKATHDLQKRLFMEGINRFIFLAYEQNELFFEGIYENESESKARVKDKIRIKYREDKDAVTFPFIIETNGKIVLIPAYSPWEAGLKKNANIFGQDALAYIRENKEGEFEYRSIDGKRMWCVFKIYEPWDWIFCMTTTIENKNKAIISFLWTALAIPLVVIILSIVIVMVISRKFVNPIRLVIQKIQDIADGKAGFEQRIAIEDLCKDEIGILASAVNKMAGDLAHSTVSIEVLQKEKNRAQRYLDVAGVMFLVLDPDGKVRTINNKGCSILGYPEAEIIGRDWFENFIPEKERPAVKNVFKRLMQEKLDSSFECFENRVVAKNGQERFIAWHNKVLEEESAGPTGILCSGEDITEKVKIEEELKKREELFQRIVSVVPVGLGIVCDRHIEWVNDNLLKMTGYQKEDIVGKSAIIFYESEDAYSRVASQFYQVLEEKDSVSMEIVWKHKDGRLLDVFLIGTVLTGKGLFKGLVFAALDISERKKNEEEKQNRLQELEVFYKASVGREERIIELKKEIEQLKNEQKK
ncbi:MAG: PAS domain S-box protein [Candidatus Omnitrophica bacterium]|nr:PAS domain S-box protein [Candidatus Omnitrophota bacterium]